VVGRRSARAKWLVGLIAPLGLGLLTVGVAFAARGVAEALHTDGPGEASLRAAGEALAAGGPAQGNGPETIKLARRFAARLEALRTSSRVKGVATLASDRYSTWCQLEPGGVCFLVRAPQLDRDRGQLREELLALAWWAARDETAALRAQGELRLGVGLRGTKRHVGVAVGRSLDLVPPVAEAASSAPAEPLRSFFLAGEPGSEAPGAESPGW